MVTQFIATGSGSDGAGGALVLILLAILFGAALYLIPSLCALIRKVPNTGSVIVINIFLGWTLVGYVVALAMALRSHPQPVAVYNHFGQAYPHQAPPGVSGAPGPSSPGPVGPATRPLPPPPESPGSPTP